MRTAFYVEAPSTITIHSASDTSQCQLRSFDGNLIRKAVGVHEVPRGIYKVETASTISFTLVGPVTAEITAMDKDSWPVPKVNQLALAPGATLESVQHFFMSAKPGDEPHR